MAMPSEKSSKSSRPRSPARKAATHSDSAILTPAERARLRRNATETAAYMQKEFGLPAK
jgi:hypothetical protein